MGELAEREKKKRRKSNNHQGEGPEPQEGWISASDRSRVDHDDKEVEQG